MHETRWGDTITDYLTGEELEETSYEEFRQQLACLLVEEYDYPRETLRTKTGVHFTVDGKPYCRVLDFVAWDARDVPLIVIAFVAGQPGTFDRELIAAARLFSPRPVPLVAITDTRDAVVHETAAGTLLGTGLSAIPSWHDIPALVRTYPVRRLSEKALEREKRILYAYSEFLYASCCYSSPPEPQN